MTVGLEQFFGATLGNGIVGIITIKNSEFNQRLGDMWAKTVVVKSELD